MQRDALEAVGCERIYEDTCSGSVTERPGLARALDNLRTGDALVVWKLDRIGLSLGHVVELVAGLCLKWDSMTANTKCAFCLATRTLYLPGLRPFRPNWLLHWSL